MKINGISLSVVVVLVGLVASPGSTGTVAAQDTIKPRGDRLGVDDDATSQSDKTLVNDVLPSDTDTKSEKDSKAVNTKQSQADRERNERLAKYLSGKDFLGRFTTDDSDGNPAAECYTISSCKLTDQPDLFEMQVRIQYGGRDVNVPLRVKILFADKTPVITVDSMFIPGLGTFDARVLIRNGRYAGTWRHDDHGGHLFGKIVETPKAAENPKPDADANSSNE
ncbi:MAG: hypothetical protein AAF958_08195 [Planctomycetota bacterium]